MSISNIYNIEKATSEFNAAIDYIEGLDPLPLDFALYALSKKDPFGVKDIFDQNAIDPILEITNKRQGLDAAKKIISERSNELSDTTKVAIMTILFRAPETSQRHAMELLTHCMRHTDAETQEDFLLKSPFDNETIESGQFDSKKAALIMESTDPGAQDTMLKANRHEAFTYLALYAYNVSVPAQNTGIAVMKQGNNAEIPFDRIEDEQLRQYCEDHETEIRSSVKMLDPDLAEELLDRLEKLYAENGFAFDRENESKNRAQEFRDGIAGMSRDEFWQQFENYGQTISTILSTKQKTPGLEADDVLGDDFDHSPED